MKKNHPFGKFMQVESGAAKKERFRQEKRSAKEESVLFHEAKKKIAEAEAKQRLLQKEAAAAKALAKAAQKNSPKATATTSNAAVALAMPLNKFIAHAGVCSRRDAIPHIKDGKVQVNGKVVLEPGFKVTEKDVVTLGGKQLQRSTNLVYVLLNKPRNFLTTMEDPNGRKTVLDLVKHATNERIYPVGRLDRNTTGVLLLTNDGKLAQKLTHPSFEIKKIYEITLDKPVTQKDFNTILGGINLEDGFIQPDALAYADVKDKHTLGIEIHSGRNRIVRRIFEHFGYEVKTLDRVMFAGLTKKDVERGKCRLLKEKEVRLLKYMNASFVKAAKK
jgi:23S rRNA pseudouridine2605 synthase